MTSFGVIPVDREISPLSGIRETLRRLKRGEAVLMFPEGSRCWDGEIGPFKPGFALLAMRSHAAVLPAAIEGAFDAWPRRNRFPRLGRTIHVHFGPPIPAEQVGSMTEEGLVAETASRVRQCQAILRARPAFAREMRDEG
jgi:1-acyl-sn-glycerol-3-phosphate acyltransferase